MLGPLRLFDNIGGGVLGAVTGLALCWAVGAVLLYLPGQTELRRYAQDSSILSTLNEEIPPERLIDTLAQHRPVRRPSPGRAPASTRPMQASSTPPGSAPPRSASCA